MYAVIETGGKQYRVTPGESLQIETLIGDIGSAVEFDKVNSGPRGGFIGPDGQMYEDPAPENPFRQNVTS